MGRLRQTATRRARLLRRLDHAADRLGFKMAKSNLHAAEVAESEPRVNCGPMKAFEQIVRDYYPDLIVDDVHACIRYAIGLVDAEDNRLRSAPE